MKHTLLKTVASIALLTTLFNCSSDDNSTPAANQIPNDFAVTATAATKGLEITLNWETATDPDGDTIIYDVFLGTTLITENTNTLTQIFNAAAYNTPQTGTVVAKDGNGGEKSIPFTVTSSSLVDIPDANFEKALIDFGTDSDTMVNGQISIQDALDATFLSIANAGISDLTGIEAFTNLTELNCNGNNLSTLDVSQNTALTILFCGANNLSSLDLSQNTTLTELDCYYNNLSTLDLSQNTALTELYCNDNNLSALDLSQNTTLTRLSFRYNNLSTLNVSQNTALISLSCTDNNLSTLDLSQNTALTRLFCQSNQLTSLNIKNGNNLNFTSFNAKSNPNLTICVDVAPPANQLITNGKDAGVTFTTTCN